VQSDREEQNGENNSEAGERCDSEELLATVTILMTVKRMVIKLHIMRK
jgi:hypothetical protein